MRLVHYKRIASAASEDALRTLQVELIDRFGLLPDATRNLFRQARIRLRAGLLGITKIEAHPGGATVMFGSRTLVDPAILVKLVQSEALKFRLAGTSLRLVDDLENCETRFEAIETLLGKLGGSLQETAFARAQA